MKPFTTLSLALLLTLLASCGTRDRQPETEGNAQNASGPFGDASADAPYEEPDPGTCAETAVSTVDWNGCQIVINRVLIDSVAGVVARWSAASGAKEAALAKKVYQAFVAFADEDGSRVYYDYVDGTIRDAIGLGHKRDLHRAFAARFDSVLVGGSLPAYTAADLLRFDADLNRVYAEDLVDYAREQEEQAENHPENREVAQGHVRDHRKHARDAQRHWIRYRDAWAELASARFSRTDSLDPAAALRAVLTRDRVHDFCIIRVSGNVKEGCPDYVTEIRYDEDSE